MVRTMIATILAWMSGALPPAAIRYLKVAVTIALAILVFWLLSTFVLTIDRLQSEWIRWTYIGLAAALTLTVALVIRHLLREEKAIELGGLATYPASRPSAERIRELYTKHRLDEVETTTSTGAPSFRSTGKSSELRIAVAGMPDAGKTALIRRLAASLSGERIAAELSELPPLSATQVENRDQSDLASVFDIVVLATDQDLRDYEMAFLEAARAYALPVIVAVTKSDLLASTQRAELAAALERRLSAFKPPVAVVFTSAEPLPVLAEVTGADGQVSEVERARTPDVKALLAAVRAAAKQKL